MAKTTPTTDIPVTASSDLTTVEAGELALDAAARSPEFPGYEAVRDLYESYLRLHRRCDDLASMVETLKHDLAQTRREMSNG